MKAVVVWAVLCSEVVRAVDLQNLGLRIEENHNEYSPMENENLTEGDILEDSGTLPGFYNAITSDLERWPKRIIPYVVDPSLKGKEAFIREAMDYIQSATKCIRFVQKNREHDFVRIAAKDGCYSNVGRKGGEQILSLGQGCDRFGIVVHELTHALGFHHEHMRFDRDSYIRVHLENVKPKFRDQFRTKKPGEHRLLTSFDYDSIMLYGSKAFTKSRDKYSMTRLDGSLLPETSQKRGLSKSDIKRIHKLYGC
ncbi:zinc metalloproteinase nas-6-like [Tropilaelaps mercedesae]|uniref:Metalloendopeptidase n=1 Tax=Tropilaelaps mercedesae TaxID=418985 RepID=A0A1V9XZN7_9ACAR|nr:zinc metalloproteinase nas-6-like [Tropilaelaps mercedesae]